MSDPSSPNYKKNVGRIVTDRYDFQKHIDGESFRHEASSIDLSPSITIDGTETSNVQDAIAKLKDVVSPPTITDATTTVKGIVKLAKDLAGTAALPQVIGIQGRPISSMMPTDGQVLTWNGTDNYWGPSNSSGSFSPGGDLTGNSLSQNVIALTGHAFGGNTATDVKSDFLLWKYNVVTPLVAQEPAVASTHGKNFSIRAQDAISDGFNGGKLILAGGSSGSTALDGGVELSIGFNNKLIQIAQLDPDDENKVISLCKSSSISSTQMPSGTGSYVIYIGNAQQVPSSGSPVGGAILYSDGGVLNVKQSNGTTFPIEPGAGAIDSIYLKKGLGQFDTLSSEIAVEGAVAFDTDSVLITSSSAKVQIGIGGSDSYLGLISGGKIAIYSGGYMEALVANSVQLKIAGALQSSADGSIVLNNTTTDWVSFSSARTMSDVFFFPHSGLYTISGSTGWFSTGTSCQTTATGVRFYLEIPIPRECQGATISEFIINYRTNTIHSPASPGNVLVYRQAAGSLSNDVLHGGAVNFTYAATGIKTLTVTLTTNNVIDKTAYRYYISVVEESGAGSTFGDTQLISFKANYTNITKHRF